MAQPPADWHGPTDSRYWSEVNEGDKIPELRYPISTKVVIMASIPGTRDAMPYHHDREYTQKFTPSRDMFVNTMFHQALIGRFCTDWSGPESDVRAMSIRMVGQVCPGDDVRVNGSVVRKYEQDGDYLVDIEVTESNQLGPSTLATVTLAMPLKQGDQVKPRTKLEVPQVEPNEDMPDFARAWLGKKSGPIWGAYQVSYPQIQYYCEMVEDGNPLYVDCDYARNGRYKGVIAPFQSLQIWTMQRAGHMGVNADAPDVWVPDRKPWPPKQPQAETIQFNPPGATDTIATDSICTYGVPLRPGDRVYTDGMEVVSCSPLKQTRLGKGYFMTTRSVYYNQRDEVVGTVLFKLLRYGVKD